MQVLALLVTASLVHATINALPRQLNTPPVNATRQLAASEVCYLGYQDLDFYGGDVGRARGEYWSDCILACAATSTCSSFTWTDFDGGTCWLKDGTATGKRYLGATSGVVRPSTPSAACPIVRITFQNADFYGGDLSSAPGTDAEACHTQCLGIPDCRYFTWTSDETCYFKSQLVSWNDAVGLVSGLALRAEKMYLTP